jgi:hypothetical protein
MRIALLGITDGEPELLTWQHALQRAALPHTTFALCDGRRRRLLLAEMRRARFQALIIANGNVLEATLTPAASRELDWLERSLHIRRLIACAYPSVSNGLQPCTWSGALDGAAVFLSPRGQEVFPYLRPELRIDVGSWAHPGWPLDHVQFETLVRTANGATLIGIHHKADGREEMVQTFAASTLQSHTHLLRPGQLRWLTRGVHLGFERHYLSLHVDDVLLPNPSWNVVTHSSDARTLIRMSTADAARSACWSRERGLRLDLVCNGSGTSRYVADRRATRDPLLDSLMAERTAFGWINHTYGHRDLDDVPRAVIESEIEHNGRWARDVAIDLEPFSLVTGGHSGLADLSATPPRAENPALAAAFAAQGIRFVACDASRPYPAEDGRPVAPGTPFAVGSALAIPRHPINLPFDAATAPQVLDRLRSVQGDRAPSTWREFLVAEAQRLFRLVVSNDPRPHYVHQSNLIQDPDGRVLLHELIDAVLQSHDASVSGMGIEQPRFEEVGSLLLRLARWRAAVADGLITASIAQARVTIENHGSAPVAVPLTGADVGTRYGASRSGWYCAHPGTTIVAVDRSGDAQLARPA